ncbi:proteasome activator complex subunit 3-like isoform X2 [Haliotis rufescens]|uniref:proteasome activator complex subunit 3-like isoform X2 n=1 Tax=Haliotis rufescens TaxID=6454 RepID=UPI001EAFB18C|nr:proteasome activator complex subunit 3-like isoform X2 [Haliotis rufescens]
MPKQESSSVKEVIGKTSTLDIELELEKFFEKTKKDAELLVNDVFPQRIMALENLHQSMNLTKLSEVHNDLNIPVPDAVLLLPDTEEPTSKKRKVEVSSGNGENISGTRVLALPNGLAPCNKHIVDLSEKMKPLIRDLIEHANLIKMWISFLIPKIEDGNNFGVSIQEETLSEARTVESEAATYLEQISRYFITRGKIVSKVAKYPHIEDYRRSVNELDEKEYVCLRLTCCELRNHYASLYDIIHKNMDKIKKPRNANADNLY